MSVVDAVFKITASVVGANAVKSLSNDIKAASTSGDNLKRSLAQGALALKAFAGSLAVREFATFIQRQVDTADHFNDLSQKTGVAVESLSQYAVAAQNSGTDIDALASGFNKLNKAIVESRNASSTAAAAFAALKIDPVGKNADQITAEIADKFKDMADGADKASIAMALFGKSGADLIPMLNMGAEEITRFNLKIDSDFAAAADAFNDKIGVMSAQANGFGVQVAKELLPALSDAVTEFGNLFGQGEGATTFGKVVSDAIHIVILPLVTLKAMVKDAAEGFNVLFAAGAAAVELAKGHKDIAGMIMSQATKDYDTATLKNHAELMESLANNASKINMIGGGNAPAQPKAEGSGSGSGKTTVTFNPDAIKESASNYKAAAKAAEEFIRTQKEGLITLKQESEYIGMTSVEIEKLKDARKFDTEVAARMKDMSKSQAEAFKAETDAIKAQRLEIIQLNYEQSRTFGAGAREFFTKYAEDATNTAEQVKTVFGNAFKGAEDAIVEFATTGKLNFKSFATSIISDLIRINVQRNITSVLSSALSGVFGGAYGGGSTTLSSGETINWFPQRAIGGYHTGGLRLVGENGPELEATGASKIFSAAETRSILSGGSSSSQNNNITVNVNMASDTTSAEQDNTKGAALGNLIANVVKSTIINEKRAGGLLA